MRVTLNFCIAFAQHFIYIFIDFTTLLRTRKRYEKSSDAKKNFQSEINKKRDFIQKKKIKKNHKNC